MRTENPDMTDDAVPEIPVAKPVARPVPNNFKPVPPGSYTAGAIVLLVWVLDGMHATRLIAITIAVLAVALALEATRLREARRRIRANA